MCSKFFKLLTKIVIVSSSGVIPVVCYALREGTKGIFDSLAYAVPRLLSISLSFSFSLTFSVLLSIKLGELGQHGKSIITKRGVMTQMLKSRSLRAKLFSRILWYRHSIFIPVVASLFFFFLTQLLLYLFSILRNISRIQETKLPISKNSTLQSNNILIAFKYCRSFMRQALMKLFFLHSLTH